MTVVLSMTVILSFIPQLESASPPPVPEISCQEVGRVTRAYVSGYQRGRLHEANIYRGETRCLTADFNGALFPDRSIVSATWSCLNPYIGGFTQGEVIGKETSVVLTAQYPGPTVIRCSALLDNGENYIQFFRLNVLDSPWFQNDAVPPAGSYNLTVTPA